MRIPMVKSWSKHCPSGDCIAAEEASGSGLCLLVPLALPLPLAMVLKCGGTGNKAAVHIYIYSA